MESENYHEVVYKAATEGGSMVGPYCICRYRRMKRRAGCECNVEANIYLFLLIDRLHILLFESIIQRSRGTESVELLWART
jgi:hypothetical protein